MTGPIGRKSFVDFAALTITSDVTLREAMERIDRGGAQIVFVVSPEGRLEGAVSDGDIRRGLLKGVQLADPVTKVMNRSPRWVSPDADQEAVDTLRRAHGIRTVPVVNDVGVLVDVVTGDARISTPLATPAVLMAGGRGQRLYPITKDIPKPLVPVGGVPMIDIILQRLHRQGFRRVHVSINHLGHLIEEHLGDGSSHGLEITYLRESAPLGTAGALAQLRRRMDGPFVVMNSDLLTDIDLRGMLAFHRRTADAATIGVRDYSFEIPYGVVRREGDLVTALAEKPTHREFVSAGIYVLEPIALELLEEDEYCDMPDLLAQLIDAGRSVGAYRIDGEWIDVGRPEDLERARSSVEERP